MFNFSVDFNLFGLKTTSHGKSDVKMNFWGQIYHVKWWSGQKVEYQQRTWTSRCSKQCWAWKQGWTCTWPWPWPEKEFLFLFKISNPAQCLITTWKDSLLHQHLSEKRGVSKKPVIMGHPVASFVTDYQRKLWRTCPLTLCSRFGLREPWCLLGDSPPPSLPPHPPHLRDASPLGSRALAVFQGGRYELRRAQPYQ